MQASPIEWTDFTSNPIYAVNTETGARGHFCVKVSPGCLNCYAAKINTSPRGFGNGLDYVEKNRGKVKFVLNMEELRAIRKRKKPTKIFLGDMTDIFQEGIADVYLDAVFATMALAPQHTFQLLTKRPERMRAYLSERYRKGIICDEAECILVRETGQQTPLKIEWPLPNVWLGVSAEDQTRANERLPELLSTPASVRYVSYEPALELVHFDTPFYCCKACATPLGFEPECDEEAELTPKEYAAFLKFSREGCSGCGAKHGYWADSSFIEELDWIIVGGESGKGAHIRAFDIEWARDVVRQCEAAGVACFVKQMGSRPVCSCEYLLTNEALEWPYIRQEHEAGTNLHRICLDGKGGNWEQWSEALRVRQFPEPAK